jgi:chromate transporter
MDGLAIGQVTPGPVVLTVAFIGYRAAGLAGALLATLGIFLPSFLNILLIVPVLWRRVSGTPGALAFSAWALPAVVGGILATSTRLGQATVHSWLLAGIFVACLAISLRWKPPAWLLIPGAGAVGGLLGLR